MRFYLLIILSVMYFFSFANKAKAIYDPNLKPNNKFGIHITDESDLISASELVNSNGGDWGYVTLVIQENDKNNQKWQAVFDKMRDLHLIPIVRIASSVENGIWKALNPYDINSWVDFLNSLNWVVKNRYLIIGNEPNRADEWGGKASPSEYADYLYVFSNTAKEKSNDFFILNAGFDAAVPNKNGSIDETKYIQMMINQNINIFDYIDGWASHSYPNPNFSGSVYDKGKGSINTYSWEIAYLKSLGVNKSFPIFITETGWAQNLKSNTKFLDQDIITKNYLEAFKSIWIDKEITAITPFILNYPQPPFEMFSWKDQTGNFYSFYNAIKEIKKIKGKPEQITSGEVINLIYPINIPQDEYFTLISVIQNTGQSIWEDNNIILKSENNCIEHYYVINKNLKPFEKTQFSLKTKISLNSIITGCNVGLYKDDNLISNLYPINVNIYTYTLENKPNKLSFKYLTFKLSEIMVVIKAKLIKSSNI